MRRLLAAAAAALAASSVAFAPSTSPRPADLVATDVVTAADAGEPGPATTSIVVFEDHVDDVAATTQRLLQPRGLQPAHVYRHALRGFSVAVPPTEVADLALDADVAYVEADRPVRAAAQSVPRGVRRVDAIPAAGIGGGVQVPVDIAIIDTGIAAHSDLRVVERVDCTDASIEPTVEYVEFLVIGACKSGGGDTDGHGTHVAGTAAARDNGSGVVGVAPGAHLWSIKVLDSTTSGSLSDLVRGIDEAARDADEIEVANISLVADGRSAAMDDAVRGATDAGVVVVAAAGNDRRSVDNVTPANSPGAISVAAITDLDGRPRGLRSGTCSGRDDRFATYSNHGADIAAPGSCIVSTDHEGGLSSSTGTSMAAPHVAGAAALRIHQQGFGPSGNRAQRVLDDLLASAAPENSTCGYRGSPSNERLLDLRRGC